MKLPRDLTGHQLCQSLRCFGYQITRQSGSHIRLTTEGAGQHHLTIPAHDPLKVGTLNSILKEVAAHFQLSREEVVERLWP